MSGGMDPRHYPKRRGFYPDDIYGTERMVIDSADDLYDDCRIVMKNSTKLNGVKQLMDAIEMFLDANVVKKED